MGSCCCPSEKKTGSGANGGNVSRLGSSLVCLTKSTLELFLTHSERVLIVDNPSTPSDLKVLLSAPFATFSAFTEHIYLTGIGGITQNNIRQYGIKCLVNVAEEIPPMDTGEELLYFKYPIVDKYSFKVSHYFHKVANQMNAAIKQTNGNVVVFCPAGMCRSATIVLAYAIKYRKTPLREAFTQLQEARPYARPNLSFFEQLIQFEFDCLKENSVEMVYETMEMPAKKSTSKKKKTTPKMKGQPEPQILVPDLYKVGCPHLFKLEVAEARAGNVYLPGGKTSVVSSTGMVSKISSKSSHLVSKGKRGSGKTRSKVKGKFKTVKEVSACNEGEYLSTEMKPFVTSPFQYETALAELELARQKLTMKPSMQRQVSRGMSSSKTKL